MDKGTKQILSPKKIIGRYKEIELLQLKRTLATTPAQRLTWLEEALEFAYRDGALPSKTHHLPHSTQDKSRLNKLDQ